MTYYRLEITEDCVVHENLTHENRSC